MIKLGNISAITIIVITIVTIIIFSINIYYVRKSQVRAKELIENGETEKSDTANISYLTNISGIVMLLIILGILIYLFIQSTSVGSKVLDEIKSGVKSLPSRIKTYSGKTESINKDL